MLAEVQQITHADEVDYGRDPDEHYERNVGLLRRRAAQEAPGGVAPGTAAWFVFARVVDERGTP